MQPNNCARKRGTKKKTDFVIVTQQQKPLQQLVSAVCAVAGLVHLLCLLVSQAWLFIKSSYSAEYVVTSISLAGYIGMYDDG